MHQQQPAQLIQSLRDASLFDHPVEGFQLIETHISWVLLTGMYAYKIKKPLNLGFLDFSTLDKRRHYCEEELRLNRRLAPQIYVDVVPITGSPDAPRLHGPGQPIEYAVRMVQFPQEAQLDRVLARGELTRDILDRLCDRVAAFHAEAPPAAQDSPFGLPERLYQPIKENFEHILPVIEAQQSQTDRLRALRKRTDAAYRRLYETFIRRKREGLVRECHGDMHLANIALFHGEIVIFDCIDFNESLRWIDVMSELAFLVMDLEERGHPKLARRALNRYLEATGDYAGLDVLRFYQVYRAMVRAKVACIRLHQEALGSDESEKLTEQYQGYLALAETYTQSLRPAVIITRGLSGCGKTTLTQALLEHWDAVRIRSDIERKRLAGLKATDSSRSRLDGGIYTAALTEQTYGRLAELARRVVHAGYPVIVDAAFLKRAQRLTFRDLAHGLNVPFVILDMQAPESVLRSRVAERQRAGKDASEADPAVLARQIAVDEPLDADEQSLAICLDTSLPPDMSWLLAELHARLRPDSARAPSLIPP